MVHKCHSWHNSFFSCPAQWSYFHHYMETNCFFVACRLWCLRSQVHVIVCACVCVLGAACLHVYMCVCCGCCYFGFVPLLSKKKKIGESGINYKNYFIKFSEVKWNISMTVYNEGSPHLRHQEFIDGIFCLVIRITVFVINAAVVVYVFVRPCQ